MNISWFHEDADLPSHATVKTKTGHSLRESACGEVWAKMSCQKNRSDNLAAPDKPAKAYMKTAWRRPFSGSGQDCFSCDKRAFRLSLAVRLKAGPDASINASSNCSRSPLSGHRFGVRFWSSNSLVWIPTQHRHLRRVL